VLQQGQRDPEWKPALRHSVPQSNQRFAEALELHRAVAKFVTKRAPLENEVISHNTDGQNVDDAVTTLTAKAVVSVGPPHYAKQAIRYEYQSHHILKVSLYGRPYWRMEMELSAGAGTIVFEHIVSFTAGATMFAGTAQGGTGFQAPRANAEEKSEAIIDTLNTARVAISKGAPLFFWQ
jgi:hypothetical protein